MLRAIATCPDSCKELVAKEITALGGKNVELNYAAVEFDVETEDFYKMHLKCRNVSRLLLVIKRVSARTPEMLYDQARRIKWTDWINENQTFQVEGLQTNRGVGHMKSNDISKKLREALQNEFMRQKKNKPKVDLKEPSVSFVAHVEGGKCTISLDSSGKSMHKRGFRLDNHPAPIKETLAASILDLAGYDGTQNFLDPFCGSGTVAIEAAYVALGKAPLIHRKKGEFGIENIPTFDKDLWRKVQEEVRNERAPAANVKIFARDIDRGYVAMAQKHALRARVEKNMIFETGSFFDLDAPAEKGLIVSNLPYGERLDSDSDEEDMIKFYQDIGDTLKRRYKGWRAALLVGADTPFKFIGLKPKRKIALLNGSIEVKLLIFDMY